MRLVIQRVSSAEVTWGPERSPDAGVGNGREGIGKGLLILVGVGPEDGEEIARRLAAKVAALRIFADRDGRTNLNLADVGGEALIVSQFTLYADLGRGRRPSFAGGAGPVLADRLYRSFASALERAGIKVKTGRFGARMAVRLINDGPVTLVLSSDDWQTRA
ncbi:MAG: D-aminoacyl-tRNA deacylase [Candidatus Dormibacteraceae bacterium]